MTITALSMSVVAVPNVKAAASAGDLIKMDGLSSVYYLGADGKRYVFPNETTYFSWYSDFSGVVTVPQSELESYPLGSNVTIRPGTKLVKITTDPKVYAVTPSGNLIVIPDEATAKTLYGDNWAKRVVDVPDAFFTNYKIASGSVSSTAYPTGSLVKFGTSADVFYINADGSASKITTEAAFLANRFKWDDVITATIAAPATAGADITGAQGTLTDTSSGAGGSASAGTGLTVALASNTAASATVIVGQALVDLGTFNFTASNDGDVKVTTLKIKRTGISADSSLTNVYLYDGTTKLTDPASPSSGVVTFNNGTGIFTVAKGTTKSITVKADIGGTSGATIGVAINAASDVTTDGATVSGSFPATGNLMSTATADSSTLGTVTIGTVTGAGTSITAGTDQATIWSAPFTVGVKDANLKYLSFKQIGTIPSDALQNIKLFVNGVQAGSTTSIDSNGMVIFDLTSAPSLLKVGNTTVEVRADVVKGSGRTFSLSLQTTSDVVVTETGYGVNVVPGGTFAKSAASTTISNGSVTITTDTSLNNTQVVKSTTNVALGRYTMKAYGEDEKITTLTVHPVFTVSSGAVYTGEGLSNVSLYVNGSQVGSSKNYLATASNTYPSDPTFGTTNLFTIPAGTSVTLEIRGDLTQGATSTMATVDANLIAPAAAFQGQTSITTSPASQTTYSGQNALTIVSGALTVSKNTAVQSQNILKNTQKVKIGSYVLSAGTAEGVVITNLKVGLATSTATLSDLTNLYVTDNTTPQSPAVGTNDYNFPVNFTVPANGTHTVDVYADVNNVTSGSTTVTYLTVTGHGATTSNSVSGSIQGQTITVQAGTLSAPTLVSSAYPSALVVGGTATKIAQYKFVATNGSAAITDMDIRIYSDAATTTTDGTDVASLTVAGVTAPVTFDGTYYHAKVSGLNIAVPAGVSGTTVDVTANLNPVTSTGQGGATTRDTVVLNLETYSNKIGDTVNTDVAVHNVASNLMVLVASAPVVNLASDNPANMASGFAATGNTEVMRFTVTAGANPINLKNVGFTPVYSGTLTATSTQYVKIYDKNNLNTALNANTNTAVGNSAQQGTLTLDSDYVIGANQTAEFVVKADLTGSWSTGNSFRMDLTATGDTDVSTGTNWKWNDSTVATYGNGYLVKNLPVTGSTFTK